MKYIEADSHEMEKKTQHAHVMEEEDRQKEMEGGRMNLLEVYAERKSRCFCKCERKGMG